MNLNRTNIKTAILNNVTVATGRRIVSVSISAPAPCDGDEVNGMYLQSTYGMYSPVTDMNHDYNNTENRVLDTSNITKTTVLLQCSCVGVRRDGKF